MRSSSGCEQGGSRDLPCLRTTGLEAMGASQTAQSASESYPGSGENYSGSSPLRSASRARAVFT